MTKASVRQVKEGRRLDRIVDLLVEAGDADRWSRAKYHS